MSETTHKTNGKPRRLNVYLKPHVWERLETHCRAKEKRTDATVTYGGEIARLIERYLPLERK